ncbi:mobilization protein [Streptomyces sp. b94]|uniref:mobilization protein n=1 Tax=Streptomyces sp. b94 TaxID=1827634 RepID=UPI0035AB8B49
MIEIDYGLRRLTTGDGTAARRPTSAERHKAQREGRERTAREELRESVRRAVAGAPSTDEFFDRLAAAGLLIRKRLAPSGDLLGYKVALPDDRNKDGEPVFYSGSSWRPTCPCPVSANAGAGRRRRPPPSTVHGRISLHCRVTGPAFARRRAAAVAWQALLVIDHGDDGTAAAQIAATGEVLDALAKTSAAHTRAELRDVASAFERASRSHVKAVRGHDRALRQAARDLVHSGPVLSRGEDGASRAMLIDMAFFVVTAAAKWHARKHHGQQAAAARQAAEHLRAAYQAAAVQPMTVLSQRGRRLTPRVRQQQANLLHQMLPELADQIQAESGWPALAVTLEDTRKAGHDPVTLLTEATARRELRSAGSMSDVLVWRLRRSAHLPALPDDRNATALRATGTPRTRRPPRSRRPARQGTIPAVGADDHVLIT